MKNPATDWTPTPTRRLSDDEQRAMSNAVKAAKAQAEREALRLVKKHPKQVA